MFHRKKRNKQQQTEEGTITLRRKNSRKIRRPTLTSQSSAAELKQKLLDNFEQYQAAPVNIERVIETLTLGATLNFRSRAPIDVNAFSEDGNKNKTTPEAIVSEPNSPRLSSVFNDNSSDTLREAVLKKERYKAAADIFNQNFKKGIEYAIAENLITENTPTQIAAFLHKNTFLNKQKIGELLGEPDEHSIQIMISFIEQLDFTDLDFDVALRHLLHGFRLPGESQKIDRILEHFAVEYYKRNSDTVFANSDAVWALSFATILLNTDAHNSQVKKKMTKEQFIHNCRGINGGEDFPKDYLSDLYDRIVLDEIRMREDGSLYPSALKKGWITVKIIKGSKVKQKWKRQWFILDEYMLLSFKKPGDVYPLFSVSMETAELQSKLMSKENKKFCFQLKVPVIAPASSKSRSLSDDNLFELYLFSLPSEREQTSWIKMLERAIHHSKESTSTREKHRRSSF